MTKEKIIIITVLALSFANAVPCYASSSNVNGVSESISTSESTSVPYYASGSNGNGVTTKISGVKRIYNKNAKDNLKNTISVSSPAGRSLKMQKYDIGSKTWKTRKVYKLGNSLLKQQITITYPKTWSNRTYGKWRLYIPAKEKKVGLFKVQYASVVSKNIKTIAYNRNSHPLNSKAAAVYDNDGYLLYTKNGKKHLKQASTTKLMTSLLACESGKMAKTYKMSSRAAKTPYANPGLKAGTKMTLNEYMHALLVCSSNESASEIAEIISGNKETFVKEMNKKAKEIGLNNTHYKNPHGLDTKGHYSCAQDVAKLIKENYKYKTFRKCANLKEYTLKNNVGKSIATIRSTWKNSFNPSGIKAAKTGYTDYALFCFASVYKTHGKLYYVATLGATNSQGRWNDNKWLYSLAQNAKY